MAFSTTAWINPAPPRGISKVQIALSLHHSKARSSTRILDQLKIWIQFSLFQSSLEGCHDRLSRMKGVLSSTKDYCISTLDGKRCGIWRYIWTAFINDANDTLGDSNFLDFKTIFKTSVSSTSPIGSGRSIKARIPCAIPAIRSWSRNRRSAWLQRSSRVPLPYRFD